MTSAAFHRSGQCAHDRPLWKDNFNMTSKHQSEDGVFRLIYKVLKILNFWVWRGVLKRGGISPQRTFSQRFTWGDFKPLAFLLWRQSEIRQSLRFLIPRAIWKNLIAPTVWNLQNLGFLRDEWWAQMVQNHATIVRHYLSLQNWKRGHRSYSSS